MKHAFRSVLIITIFTFSSQLILFLGQIIAAAIFGADSEMDAFLAASTLPQYMISVLLGSLGFVFIPFFIDYKSAGKEVEAYRLAVTLFNNCILFLAIISVLGIIFARPLLILTAPGLSPEALEVGVKVAIITWPTILATGALSLLASIYQAEKKFRWQAVVPFIGALTNVLLLIILAPSMGILALALATTCGVVIQVILLLRVITKEGKYQFVLNWKDGGLREIVRLTIPLVLVAVVTKFTPVIDRYLASGLSEGSISHLNFAFKVITIISVLISTGASTVIFPKMASDVSSGDLSSLRNTMSFGIRLMCVIIAPVIAIGISLSSQVINILFYRGEFTATDSEAVAVLLNIYLIALIAMCLGNITGKGFYALKQTKTLAIFGAIEAAAYVIYTFFLTRWLGVIGIAIGYVIYFNVSLAWQVIILKFKIGGKGSGGTVIKSFGKTIIAALAGGVVTQLVIKLTSITFVQVIAGGLAGLLTYTVVLQLLRSPEIGVIKEMIFGKLIDKQIK
jgi:putative peptidoglycan lipid II flippase